MAGCREATPPPGARKPGPRPCVRDDSDELDVFSAEHYFNGDDAPWCTRSSSSFRPGTTHDRSVAVATSSSEASWNSRTALLPEGKVLAAAPSVVEAEHRGAGSERPRGNPSPHSHLRRWLLGVAGCACVGGSVVCDGEDSSIADELSGDEVEEDNVAGVGGKELTDRAGELFQRTDSKDLAAAVRVRPGRSLGDGDVFLAVKAASPPVQVQLSGDGRRQAVNSGECSAPMLSSATTAALLHGQRRQSCEMLLSTTNQGSAFTIAAGNTARGGGGGLHSARGGPGTSPCDASEDDAAPSELGCAYPPSEASVVWSVATAEGAASCNFSSAASGCYYHIDGGEERQAAGRSNRRRRSGLTNGGGLLTCIGDKAVDATRPARWTDVEPVSVGKIGALNGGRNRRSAEYPDVMRRR